jgi:peptidoglycan/LPS O-acetylase OafA/YrhL
LGVEAKQLLQRLNKIAAYLRHETTTGLQLPEIDAFRGFACLGVLLFHSMMHSNRWKYFMLKCGLAGKIFAWPLLLGWAGLDLFFFLSGFLLFISFGKSYYEKRPEPKKGKFYKRRFLRLAPAYYVSLILMFALSETFALPNLTRPSLANMAYHLTFLYNINAEYFNTINIVYWTLAIEAQFYLILPFIANWFYGKRWLVALPAVLITSAMYKLIVAGLYDYSGIRTPIMTINQLISRLDEFVIGMCFANLWLHLETGSGRLQFLTRRRTANIMVVLGIVFLGATLIFFTNTFGLWLETGEITEKGMRIWEIIPTFLALGFGILVLGTIYSRSLKKIIANPFIDVVGILSYSVYLWHTTIINQLNFRFPELMEESLARTLLFIALVLLVSMAVGVVGYITFEKPFLRKRLS